MIIAQKDSFEIKRSFKQSPKYDKDKEDAWIQNINRQSKVNTADVCSRKLQKNKLIPLLNLPLNKDL